MNKPNFTPGPWRADRVGLKLQISNPKEWMKSGAVAEVDLSHAPDAARGIANARLIAAAPALYAALGNLMSRFEQTGEAWMSDPAMQQARATIALVDSPDATTGAEIASRL